MIGHLTGWLATLKGIPSGYNKDLQEDKEATFDAEATLANALGATTAVMGPLKLDREACARAAAGLLLATDVADFLTMRGMPFRTAHEVVGAMVRQLVTEGRDFSSPHAVRMAWLQRTVRRKHPADCDPSGVGQGGAGRPSRHTRTEWPRRWKKPGPG